MSFRTRLTGFFLVIVMVPMIAVGVLVFRLIGTSEQGKADARASGLASTAVSLYESESANGRIDAETIAQALPRSDSSGLLGRACGRSWRQAGLTGWLSGQEPE